MDIFFDLSPCLLVSLYQICSCCYFFIFFYYFYKPVSTDKGVPGIQSSGIYENLSQLSAVWKCQITCWTSTTNLNFVKCQHKLWFLSTLLLAILLETLDSFQIVLFRLYRLSHSPKIFLGHISFESYLCFEWNPTPVRQVSQ